MSCLNLLAHCHRTGTRIQVHRRLYANMNMNSNANPNALVNAMETSLYERSPVRCVITPEAMRDLLLVRPEAPYNNKCCPITQDEFAEGDAVLVLPCGHAFCRDAIQTWLETERAECPVCRHALPAHEVMTEVEVVADAVVADAVVADAAE